MFGKLSRTQNRINKTLLCGESFQNSKSIKTVEKSQRRKHNSQLLVSRPPSCWRVFTVFVSDLRNLQSLSAIKKANLRIETRQYFFIATGRLNGFLKLYLALHIHHTLSMEWIDEKQETVRATLRYYAGFCHSSYHRSLAFVRVFGTLGSDSWNFLR